MSASLSPRLHPAAPEAEAWLTGSWTPWTWAAMSLSAFLAAPFAAIVLVAPMDQLAPAAEQLSMPIAWTAVAALGALVAARLCFGTWPRVAAEAWILLATGAAFAGAVEASLHAWAGYRYGYFDPDLIGPTALFAFIVVGVAVAAFGVLIAPRRAGLPPLLATLAGVIASVLALGGNLTGLADGLDPESVIPAWTIGAAAAYVLLAGVVATWTWLRPVELDR